MAKMTMVQALNLALKQEMAKPRSVSTSQRRFLVGWAERGGLLAKNYVSIWVE